VSGVASGLLMVKVRAAVRRGRLNSAATWAIRISEPALSASSRWTLTPTMTLWSTLMAPLSL